MMTSDDKVGGWVKKGQNHDDVILESPLVTCKLALALVLALLVSFFMVQLKRRNMKVYYF